MNKLPRADSKPFVGWKACEGKFYLDGMPLTAVEAYALWKNKTATFLPHASEIMKKLELTKPKHL